MTQDEFNKTAFRKGDKVKVNTGTFLIDDVSLEGQMIGCNSHYYNLDEIEEYIPVENEIEQIIEKQESEYYKQEQASFWKDVWLTSLEQEDIKSADDCTKWADQALEDYKQRFKS